MKKIDFSENENVYMPSKKLTRTYKKTVNMIKKYPDYKNVSINSSIATFYKIPIENVTVISGVMEGIYLLSSIFKKQKTTIFIPTFWAYEKALLRNKHILNKVYLDDNLNYNEEKILLEAEKSNVMFLCNPNNPTLSFLSKKFLIELIKNNSQCEFIIDETMLMFDEKYNKKTLTKVVTEYNNLTVLVSFSKIFVLAGIRSGALISSSKKIELIKENLVPYSISKIVEEMIPVALKDTKYLEYTKKQINKNKEQLYKDLSKLDDHLAISGNTNFILLRLPKNINSTKLSEYLYTKNMAVRDIKEAYPQLEGEWIRISINKPKQNRFLIKSIKKYEKAQKL